MSKPVCKMDNKKSWRGNTSKPPENFSELKDTDLTRNEIYFEGQNYEL